jgi:hypothetical protein
MISALVRKFDFVCGIILILFLFLLLLFLSNGKTIFTPTN